MGRRVETFRAYAGAIGEDVRRVYTEEGLLKAAGVGVLGVGAFVYQFGGAEATIFNAGIEAYAYTPNKFVAIGSAALAAGGASVAIETTLTYGVGYTIGKMKSTTGLLLERKRQRYLDKGVVLTDEVRSASLADTATIAVFAGSPGETAGSAIRNPGADTSVHIESGLKTMKGLGWLNLGLGTAGGIALTTGIVAGRPELIQTIEDHSLYSALALAGILQTISLGYRHVVQPAMAHFSQPPAQA